MKQLSRSVGETTKPMVKCEKCEKGNEVTINLKEIQPAKNPSHTMTIDLVGNIKVQMRYPTLKSAASLPFAPVPLIPDDSVGI